MNQQNQGRLLFAAAVSFLLLLIVWFVFSRGGSPTGTAAVSEPPLSSELDKLRSDAFQSQQDRDWCRAKEAWQSLLNRLGEDEEHSATREEARANLRLSAERCEAPDLVVVGVELPLESTPQPKVSEQDLRQHYPVGKTIRSVALLDASGRGSNRRWFWKSEAHFVYESRAILETRILSNSGTIVDFEVALRDVSQDVAVAFDAIELAPPESPLLPVLWSGIEELLKLLPPYPRVRRFITTLNKIDPKLRGTLTWFARRVRPKGTTVGLSEAEIELKDRIDALAGHRLQLVYAQGYGVQTIKLLEGGQLPKDDLLAFARNSGLLMDFVLSKVAHTKVGETFDVDVADVLRMIGFNYDIEVRGALKLKREADKEGLAMMSVVGGEVVVEAQVEGEHRTGTFTPRGGTVEYDLNSLFVRKAQLTWKVDLQWFTEDHLLFGTQNIRDLDIRSYYEAEKK